MCLVVKKNLCKKKKKKKKEKEEKLVLNGRRSIELNFDFSFWMAVCFLKTGLCRPYTL